MMLAGHEGVLDDVHGSAGAHVLPQLGPTSSDLALEIRVVRDTAGGRHLRRPAARYRGQLAVGGQRLEPLRGARGIGEGQEERLVRAGVGVGRGSGPEGEARECREHRQPGGDDAEQACPHRG